MPPKSAKSKASSVPKIVEWQPILDTKVINAYSWSVHVILLIEFNSEHIEYVDLFNEIASQGTRSCINILTYESLKQSIKRYSGEPATNPEIQNLHPECRIYPFASEDATKFISKNHDIPSPLLAKLIKLEILRMKFNHLDVANKKRQLNADISNEFIEMINEQKKCLAKAGAKGVEEPKKETSSKLFKKGEEWKIREDIDDSPKGGPNLYIILSTFYNPELIIDLIKNDVPLIAILQMRREDDELDDLGNFVTNPKAKPTKGKDTVLRRIHDIHNFWHNYAHLIQIPYFYSKLENVAFVTFKTPTFEWNKKTKSVSPENEILMYNNVANAVYDIEDILRQYANFMNHMKVLTFECPISNRIEDFGIYNGLLNLIPNECITIPIILNCILEQVVNMTPLSDVDESETSSNTHSSKSSSAIHPPSRAYRHGKFKTKFSRIFNRITETNKSIIPCMDTQPNVQPITIEHGNDIKYKSFHLDHINLDAITLNVLYYHIIPMLWRSILCLPEDEAVFYNCHMTKLLNEIPNKTLSKEALWNYLHVKVFEKMSCTSKMADCLTLPACNTLQPLTGKQFHLGSVQKLSPLIRDHKTNPLSINDILLSNDLAKLFTRLDEIHVDSKAFSMNNYTSYENLSMPVMLQQLYKASLTFNCIDYHHFPFTDVFLLRFHNSYSQEGLVKDNWEIFIPTCVCFRDFVNYVYNENKSWIDKQEIKYKALCEIDDKMELTRINIQKANEALLKMDPEANFNDSMSLITNESDYLLPGSIKEQIYKKKQEELEMKLLTTGTTKSKQSATPKKKKEGSKIGSKKSGKKSMNAQQTLENNLFPPFLPESPYQKVILPVQTAGDEDSYDFIGYELDTVDRVQISGDTSYIYSGDQSFIKVEKIRRTFSDEQILAIEILKHSNSLYLYSPMLKYPYSNDEFMFHVNVSNGIILSFSTPKVQIPIVTPEQTSCSSVIKRSMNSNLSDFGSKQELADDKKGPSNLTVGSKRMSQKHPSRIESQIPTQLLEIDDKRQLRIEQEKRLHEYLMGMSAKDVLKPKLLNESEFLKQKNDIIIQLEEARDRYYPCYKIHSSKLHIYKYIKRIKPYVTLNISGVLKRLKFQPRKITHGSTSNETKLHEKWTKLSTTFDEPIIPLTFNFQCSWPNGLCIKTVSTSFDYSPYYIKQYFSKSGHESFDEQSRCFLSNGTILVFRSEGRMKILCPDTRIFNCQVDGFKPINLRPNINRFRNKLKKQNRINMTTQCYSKRFKETMRNIRIKKHLINGKTSLRIPYSRRMYLKKQKKCFKIASELFIKNPELIPIPEYTALSMDGTKTTVRNNKICGIQSKLLVDISTDLTHNEIYTEREDNTLSLLHNDGILEVSYPDGTRITTGFDIEDYEITVDFTEDEYHNLLLAIHEEKQILDALNNVEHVGSTDDVSEEDELVFEPFVSVILICTFEHPKYARISYRGGVDFSSTISMADDVTVNIDKIGQYVADLDDYTKLSLFQSIIVFEQNTCCACDTRSRSEINYMPFLKPPEEGIRTFYINSINTVGQEVCIDYEGNISYQQTADSLKRFISDENHSCKSYLDNKSIINENRFFLLKRTLDGSEFIHKLEQNKYLSRSLNKTFCSIITNDDSDDIIDSKGDIMTVTYALNKNYSEYWMMPINKVIPSNIRRKDALPSTYYPGGWLSAYPKFSQSFVCCSDVLNMEPPTQTKKLPDAMIRRQFMSMKFYCNKKILHGPLLDQDAERSGATKIKRSIRPNHPNYKHRSSALRFRDRWYTKQCEMQYYKQVLQNRQVPKFFSKEMEVVLFDKTCAEPIDSEPKSSNITKCNEIKDDYKDDLVHIAEQWAKRGYMRYQPQFKKCTSTAVQTKELQICTSAGANVIRVNDETSEICICQRKTHIPVYKLGKPRVMSKSESSFFDVDCITARPFKQNTIDLNTGARPFIKPMSIQTSAPVINTEKSENDEKA